MKKFDKFVLFIVSMIGICISIFMLSSFYPLPYVSEVLKEIRALFLLDYIFAGFSAFICLCFFILLLITLFYPNQSDFLTIKKNKGKLYFSKKTVESAVKYSFADLRGIDYSRIKVKLNKNPNKTKIYVKLSLNDTKELAPLSESVQEKIAETLQSSLEIAASSITVKVTESSRPPGGEKKEDISKETRII